MKSLSSSNPIILHSPQSMEREDYKMQIRINRIASRIIHRGDIPKDKIPYIAMHPHASLILLPS